MEHAQSIIDATQEIFSSMIMLEVSPGEPFSRKQGTINNSISGIIGLAGSLKGLMAIHLPNEAAIAVTSAFLGMDVEEVDEDVQDAIGELANMLAGSLKTALDPSGSEIKLSMPSSVHGDEYSIDCIAGAEIVSVPFTFNDVQFMVELQYSQDS